MPLWLFPAALAVAATATLIAGIWLVLHLTALTKIFAGNADLVPSPRPARASRRAVWFALAVFVLGALATVIIQVLVITGVANDWVG